MSFWLVPSNRRSARRGLPFGPGLHISEHTFYPRSHLDEPREKHCYSKQRNQQGIREFNFVNFTIVAILYPI
jgi:hypothetical protein